MNMRIHSSPYRIRLAGFSPDVASRLPTWDGNVLWHTTATDPVETYDYSFALDTSANDSLRTITVVVPYPRKNGLHEVPLSIGVADEMAILQILIHCFVLPCLRDGLIGVDYADFTCALNMSSRGHIYHSMETCPATAIKELYLQSSVSSEGISTAHAACLCLTVATYPTSVKEFDTMIAPFQSFLLEDKLFIVSIMSTDEQPRGALLLLHEPVVPDADVRSPVRLSATLPSFHC